MGDRLVSTAHPQPRRRNGVSIDPSGAINSRYWQDLHNGRHRPIAGTAVLCWRRRALTMSTVARFGSPNARRVARQGERCNDRVTVMAGRTVFPARGDYGNRDFNCDFLPTDSRAGQRSPIKQEG